MENLIIWDFDKTIGIDQAIASSLMEEVVKHEEGKLVVAQRYDTDISSINNATDVWRAMDSYRERKNNGFDTSEYLDLLIAIKEKGIISLKPENLKEYAKDHRLFDGIPDIFYDIRSAGARQIILSSGIDDAIRGVNLEKGTLEDLEREGIIDNIIASSFDKEGNYIKNRIRSSDKRQVLKDHFGDDPKYKMTLVTDSLNDKDAAEFIRYLGGNVILVHHPGDTKERDRLIIKSYGWSDYVVPADYSFGSKAHNVIMKLIK